jgi:hypothetical protein
MPNTYLAQKAAKKKKALKYVWMMLAFGAVLILMIYKFAVSGALDDIGSGAPSSDDVYAIAKVFVKPLLKSDDAQFSDSGYQFGTKTDSVYVIKSSVVAGGQKTDFEITIKYLGGSKDDQRSWQVIDMKEN